MKLHSTLEIINSKRDKYGNTQYAFRFTDHETGKTAQGKISGGESNIYGMRMGWTIDGEWDRGIQVVYSELGERKYNALTKDWEYAGCVSDDLRDWTKEKLSE